MHGAVPSGRRVADVCAHGVICNGSACIGSAPAATEDTAHARHVSSILSSAMRMLQRRRFGFDEDIPACMRAHVRCVAYHVVHRYTACIVSRRQSVLGRCRSQR